MQICHSTLFEDDAEPGTLQKSAMMARTHANTAIKGLGNEYGINSSPQRFNIRRRSHPPPMIQCDQATQKPLP
jgi:hypothetical protein